MAWTNKVMLAMGLDLFAYALGAVCTGWLGAQLFKAAAHFQTVVTTQGADCANLMAALEHLRRFLRLKYLLILIPFLVLVAVSLLSLFALPFILAASR